MTRFMHRRTASSTASCSRSPRNVGCLVSTDGCFIAAYADNRLLAGQPSFRKERFNTVSFRFSQREMSAFVGGRLSLRKNAFEFIFVLVVRELLVSFCRTSTLFLFPSSRSRCRSETDSSSASIKFSIFFAANETRGRGGGCRFLYFLRCRSGTGKYLDCGRLYSSVPTCHVCGGGVMKLNHNWSP